MGCRRARRETSRTFSAFTALLATSFLVLVFTAHFASCLPEVPRSSAATRRPKSDCTRSTTTSTTTTTSAIMAPASNLRRTNATKPEGKRTTTRTPWTAASPRTAPADVRGPRIPRPVVTRSSGRHRHHSDESNIVRYYSLFNRCSLKIVRIAGRHVDARAAPTDQFTILRVESYGTGSRIRIQGNQSRNFLCFNRNGSLIVRSSGEDGKCVFQELLTDGTLYTEFQSTFNSLWFIAFKANGRPMAGDLWTKHPRFKKCREFLKMTLSNGDASNPVKNASSNRKQGRSVDFHNVYPQLNSTRSKRH